MQWQHDEGDSDSITMQKAAEENLGYILSGAQDRFSNQSFAHEVMIDVEAALQQMRSRVNTADWKSFIVPSIRQHPIMELLLQDPLAAHSYQKPRGYPGDAELLDLVYLESEGLEKHTVASELGKNIFEYTSKVKACGAVRARKELLAREIKAVLSRVPKSRILSVASGHLRELGLVNMEGDAFAQFVAFDQDTKSLQRVSKEWAHLGVRPVLGHIKDLGNNGFEKFDLIYAAGLYDYLSTPVAKKLTTLLFHLLDPGGVLLLANFLPDIWESGYMEAVMDWWLLQRSKAEIESLIEVLPTSQILGHETWADSYNRIGYLRVTKA